MLAEMVQDNDEPILRHLEDITLKLLDNNPMVGISCRSGFQKKSYATFKYIPHFQNWS